VETKSDKNDQPQKPSDKIQYKEFKTLFIYRALFIMETSLVWNPVYYGTLFITGHCLLWNPVYYEILFIAEDCLLWNPVYYVILFIAEHCLLCQPLYCGIIIIVVEEVIVLQGLTLEIN
jgi:hypothetical protein